MCSSIITDCMFSWIRVSRITRFERVSVILGLSCFCDRVGLCLLAEADRKPCHEIIELGDPW